MEEFKPQRQPKRIQGLLDKAAQQGYATLDEIMEIFPKVEEDLTQLQNLFAYLYDQGIEVYDGEEERAKAKEEPGGDDGDRDGAFDLSDIPTDDSVSLYFKEMSRVPLLTR